MSPSDPFEGKKFEEIGRLLLAWMTAVFIASFTGFAMIYTAYDLISTGEYMNIVKEHYPVMMGIPVAAATAIFVVLLMRSVSGNIELGLPGGISFKGAAAPILFWVLCFLAIIVAIKMLW
jgi:hypothetical protein